MTHEQEPTKALELAIWECIYDHGNGKCEGEKSAKQRAAAFEALQKLSAELEALKAREPARRYEIMSARTADAEADEYPEPWAYQRGWQDAEAHHNITSKE